MSEGVADRTIDHRLEREASASRALTTPAELRRLYSASERVERNVVRTRDAIGAIVGGDDARLLVVVGPCSVHDPIAAIDYAHRLLASSARYAEELLVVMRVYVEKPRTRLGWKGLVSDPHLNGTGDVDDGLRLARRLFVEIAELGLPIATEIVNPLVAPHIADLVSWAAIGARTVESQVHRELASGLACPVGFKNSVDGSVLSAVNAMHAAAVSHDVLTIDADGRAVALRTIGNARTHVVLRGGATANFSAPSVAEAAALLQEHGLPARVMVDCGHANARASAGGQTTAALDVAAQIDGGSRAICGVMLESNLIAGAQPLVKGLPIRYGQSITDACIDLAETGRIFDRLASAVRRRRDTVNP